MSAKLCRFVLSVVSVVLASVHAAEVPPTVWLDIDTKTAALPPVQHGLEKLGAALEARGWRLRSADAFSPQDKPEKIDLSQSWRYRRLMVGLPSADHDLRGSLRASGLEFPSGTESLVTKKVMVTGGPSLVAIAGADARGLMYALLDTAKRVSWAKAPTDPFSEVRDTTESPHIRERSISVYTMNRAYWESRFYDEKYWTRYFDTLAANRFNKFLIVFGYENGGFLAPCYPYFFDTPGFPGVRMRDLTPEQQKKNLAALNRLIELAHARGIAVAVGIWDHIYRGGVQTGGNDWEKEFVAAGQPVPNTVTGVTTENLNAYTLASLEKFLTTFPALDEIQFRIHEESGLKRSEMDGFWREVFTMAKRVAPKLLFEARAKGTPDSVIATALDLGVNLRVETKFWMEQMGLPFHPTHVNPQNQRDRRHGYADLLRYPKRYDMNWRLWNGGTARVLLWADPDYVRRYGDAAQLYDSPIWDVNEPLATKMEAQRPDLPVFDLMPEKYRYYDYEFERYWHFFQVWGRLGYNPKTPPEVWTREFERRFGAASRYLEKGLAVASKVLPLIVASSCYPYSGFPTTRGWAERQSLGASLESYSKNTGTDTQLFESFEEASRRILAGGTTAKQTPDLIALYFESMADDILADVAAAEKMIGEKRGNEFDSTITDLKILAQLARFHALRSIAAVHYNLFKRGLKLSELVAATYKSREVVAAWRELVAIAGDRYSFDLAMGARNYSLCGHWRDELVKLEHDLKDLEAQCCPPEEATLKEKVWQPITFRELQHRHLEGARITRAIPGQPLRITARDPLSAATSVRLRYRHVTQFEDYLTLDMTPTGRPGEFTATVPGEFLVPQWDFMYFIEAIDQVGRGWMWPDFTTEAPYVIVKLERDGAR